MPAHSMTARHLAACQRRHARSLAPARAVAAEGVGWAAYGLFYLTVLTAFLGLPIGLGFIYWGCKTRAVSG